MRALERAAAAGDVEAEALLLKRRLGTGGLGRRKLRLAAYLGHPAAERAFGERLRRPDQRLRSWVRGLVHFGGVEAAERIGVALAELGAARVEEQAPREVRLRAALAAAQACARCPCEEHAREATRHSEQAREATLELAGVTRRAYGWAQVAAYSPTARAAQLVAFATRMVAEVAEDRRWNDLGFCVELAEDVRGAASVRRELRRALLRWALELEESPPG